MNFNHFNIGPTIKIEKIKKLLNILSYYKSLYIGPTKNHGKKI